MIIEVLERNAMSENYRCVYLERSASDPGADAPESWAVIQQPCLRDGSEVDFRRDLKNSALALSCEIGPVETSDPAAE